MIKRQKTNVAEIIQLRGLGYSQKEIADELKITQQAISRHLKNIKNHAKKNGLITKKSVNKNSSEKQKRLISVEKKTGQYQKSDYGVITRLLNAAVKNLVKNTTNYERLYHQMELETICIEKEAMIKEFDRKSARQIDIIKDLKFIEKLEKNK